MNIHVTAFDTVFKIISHDHARMDYLHDRLESGQIQVSKDGLDLYLGVWSVEQICSHETISEIQELTDISERADSHNHHCDICGRQDGSVSRYKRTDLQGYGFSVHASCLQEFATKCSSVLDDHKSELVATKL